MKSNSLSRKGYSIFGGIGPINRRSYWVCGHATVEGDYITLDLEKAVGYVPFEGGGAVEQAYYEEHLIDGVVQGKTKPKYRATENVALALANLSLPIEPAEAVAFAGNFGLLFKGQYSNDLTENFREWEKYVFHFHNTLSTFKNIKNAIKGDAKALNELMEIAENKYLILKGEYEKANEIERNVILNDKSEDYFLQVDEILYGANSKERDKWVITEASNLIAFFVNSGLACVTEQIVAETVLADAGVLTPQEDRFGKFAFDSRAECLIGFAFHQLAMLIVENRPLKQCANSNCQQLFEPRQNSKKYCSSRCGGQKRQRDFQDRKKVE